MEHADDAALVLRCHPHESFHHHLGTHPVVDAVDEVAHAIEHHEVGVQEADALFEQRDALLEELHHIGRHRGQLPRIRELVLNPNSILYRFLRNEETARKG